MNLGLKNSLKKLLASVLASAMILTAVPFASAKTEKVTAAGDCTVNMSSVQQTIRGFGGMNHTVWAGDLTSSQRDTAFGNGDKQLGFSILRIHVDENKNNWSKELATAKAAIAKGAVVFASPWNPPADMCEKFTRNGVANQQRLKYSSYAAYAKHLNDFVTYMKNNGVNLYAISVQNEPDYAHTWTWWTPDEILNFMKNYAGSINCKVIAPESFSYLKNMSDPILNDSTALKNMDILGTHFYGTSESNMPYPLFQQKGAGKELWMTEVYVPNSTSSADTWPEAIDVSYNMHNALVRGNFQAYVWWYIRRSYGPMKEDGTISKRGYCMAQYSKFVRPGYTRVSATVNPNTNIYVSAYKGGNKAVIVAINKGTSTVTQKFAVNNGGTITNVDRYRTSASENLAKTSNMEAGTNSFWAALPANSVSTFVCTMSSSATPVSPSPSVAASPSPSTNTMGATAKLEDGWYYIKNLNAQKYLQVTNNKGAASQNVEIGTGSGVSGQKWYLTNTSDGYITLTSALGNYMMDVLSAANADGTNIQIYNGYSGNSQKFIVKSTSQNGVYTIATKVSNSAKVIDVYNFGKTDGTNVCQWTYSGAANQQFIFEKTSVSESTQTSLEPSVKPSTPATSSAPSVSTGLPSGIKCEYSVVSDWGSSFQGQIVLTNNSTKTYNGWTLSFDYNSSINSLWGAELASQTGTKVVVANAFWDTSLTPGASVTISFTAAGTGKNAPINYSFK